MTGGPGSCAGNHHGESAPCAQRAGAFGHSYTGPGIEVNEGDI